MFYKKLQGQKQISFVILLSYFFFSPFFFYDKKMTLLVRKSNTFHLHTRAPVSIYMGGKFRHTI